MSEHVYVTDDGERDIRSEKRKTIREGGKVWRYSHPLVQPGDVAAGMVLIEPDWAHTVYQAGDRETDAWRKRGGLIDERLNMPRLRNRQEIAAYQGMRRDMDKGKSDERYDFGIHGGQ